jgi:DNA (cytosine-5)-methyltransferase 1
MSAIPIVDIFAGPGGLGEGFCAYRMPGRRAPQFEIVLSIEKDDAAHQTLQLRTLYRQFPPADVPKAYFEHLRGKKSRDVLFKDLEPQATRAREIAWKAELGKEDHRKVDRRIKDALAGAKHWVLCGGPPCQAYSVIGRSRNGGIDENDPNVYLYREYLRILAEHAPPAFILENVKGLLSFSVGEQRLFQEIIAHLQDPRAVVAAGSEAPEYELHSLVAPPRAWTLDGQPEYDPSDFIIKAEDYGIPQSRHRVIILGIRKDLGVRPVRRLTRVRVPVHASQVLSGLPRLRSGLTKDQDGNKTKDGKNEWRDALTKILALGVLDGLPNGRSDDLRSDIEWTLGRIALPRADRGGEFVPRRARSDYLPDWFCDSRLKGVCNHYARPHMVGDLHRYLFAVCYTHCFGTVPELGDFPPRLLPRHKNVGVEKKKEYFDDRFRVQVADRPATTITSHLAKDGHYFIHYDEKQCRSFTVRELLLLRHADAAVRSGRERGAAAACTEDRRNRRGSFSHLRGRGMNPVPDTGI